MREKGYREVTSGRFEWFHKVWEKQYNEKKK